MTNETQFPTLGFPDASPDLPPPTQIGEFKILSVLGKGGMGAVWHASDLRLDKSCAVKFIEGEYAAMPEAQLRFQRDQAEDQARKHRP